MSSLQNIEENPEENEPKNIVSVTKQDLEKGEQEKTAVKDKDIPLNESQEIRIRNQLFAMFKHNVLKGKIKVQDLDNLGEVEITLYHRIKNHNVNENVKVIFSSQYPMQPPKLQIHSCNLTHNNPEYTIPSFLASNQLLSSGKWNQNIHLADVLGEVLLTLEDYHASEIQRLMPDHDMPEEDSCQARIKKEDPEEMHNLDKIPKTRRKSSNMTGCADKELTETKNLNRHFRSKLRQVLRDLVPSHEHENQDSRFVDSIFTPNRVGFQDIRRALRNQWFNAGVRKQMNCGQFLHKILRGMMGIKSKKLMIKYYHVMVSAAQQPESFVRWKYD